MYPVHFSEDQTKAFAPNETTYARHHWFNSWGDDGQDPSPTSLAHLKEDQSKLKSLHALDTSISNTRGREKKLSIAAIILIVVAGIIFVFTIVSISVYTFRKKPRGSH